MNYEKIYNAIIDKARSEDRKKGDEVYYEGHHIIPRCLGGEGRSYQSNHTNIVLLTAKEHYICHKLLVLIYPNNKKLQYALWCMINGLRKNKRYIPSGRIYVQLREAHRLLIIGRVHSEETKTKMSCAKIGKCRSPFSEDHKKNLSNANKGRIHSEKTKKKMSGRIMSEYTRKKLLIANLGKRHSEESKKKMSNFHKGKILSDETRKKMSDSQLGHIVSDETKKKISDAKIGKSRSEETKKKISESHKGSLRGPYKKKLKD